MKLFQLKIKNITITDFWDVTPCSLTETYQSSEEILCFHLQDLKVCANF
jgi:hypothetical protein